ncbi:MAG: restriction endonuclease [Candidatus Hadarchaeales archaeon]
MRGFYFLSFFVREKKLTQPLKFEEKKTQRMSSPYRKGRIAEKKIVNYLAKRGFTNIRRSAGSRGAADIRARGPSGTKFYIQAKSGSAHPTREEIRKLRALAKKRQGVAVVIHKDGGHYRWKFFGSWVHRRRRS